MKESFLHFVWQFQQFNKSHLHSVGGDKVEVFATGNHNTNAGPDFENATIRIGKITWHGQVEIHTTSSCWKLHGHQHDPAYDNVVLHVVWENDKEIKARNGKSIPTIELKDRVSHDLVMRCNQLLNNHINIPCSGQLSQINQLHVFSMQQQATIERLKYKSNAVFDLLGKNKGNWEEATYQLLAKNFGFKINSEPFLRLAQNTPLKYLKKHSGNLFQVEALLFGMAGFLHQSPVDDYHSLLMNEYEFLSAKYSLTGKELSLTEWKHLRLRPANFPAVRISQLASLLHSNPHLFDSFIHAGTVKNLKKLLKTTPSDYWASHYNFGKETNRPLKGIGVNSIENLLINTTVPLLAAYSRHVGESAYMEQAVAVLESLKPEANNITSKWEALGISNTNAFESQALIETYNNYCLKKRCLSCKIGVGLINAQCTSP
ncbi:MAG: DUF2851 family protein [Cyclobacteriaceae bacterium]